MSIKTDVQHGLQDAVVSADVYSGLVADSQHLGVGGIPWRAGRTWGLMSAHVASDCHAAPITWATIMEIPILRAPSNERHECSDAPRGPPSYDNDLSGAKGGAQPR